MKGGSQAFVESGLDPLDWTDDGDMGNGGEGEVTRYRWWRLLREILPSVMRLAATAKPELGRAHLSNPNTANRKDKYVPSKTNGSDDILYHRSFLLLPRQ